ncbi:CHASE domain-containing protein [Spongiibacter sp. KMU-158]|uniref:histidine kinase n=1 Tax=Spongiibacter pelagi TaxID=2760804 RepID=A0A927GWA6_9GAMM|nr:CHASE domain-containing protein [Spongiibacter pelagi]MBD2858933.1 CHASE domain-containing protein [Spongiibacter pelagi]
MKNSPSTYSTQDLLSSQEKLERAGRMHFVHWLVLVLSLFLTVGIWQYSKNQLSEKTEIRFSRESDHVVDLIVERLQKYEDALWSGAALIRANGGDIDFPEWQAFAEALNLEEKYKGINGIGVIHAVQREKLAAYLDWQRQSRPDYGIHHQHAHDLLLPISYIIPVGDNAAAVGLDVAYEKNRLEAAIKARDSRQAQITGPIVLVQDAENMPGFLFYVPFYDPEDGHFRGLVYAPFVVDKLMQGTLEKARRQVEIRLKDGAEVLYDEVRQHPRSADAKIFSNTYEKWIYGRLWTIEIQSTPAFYNATSNNQPELILVGGIVIDILLLTIFLVMSRANKNSVSFGKRMARSYIRRSEDLEKAVNQLESKNRELEQFTYITSHDLQEPLQTIRSFIVILKREYGEQLDAKGRQMMDFVDQSSVRMQSQVKGLLDYGRIGHKKNIELIDLNDSLRAVQQDMADTFTRRHVTLTVGELPTLWGVEKDLRLMFQNLISNAIKFTDPDVSPKIDITSETKDGHYKFSVCDNGIGIPEDCREKVFGVFKRLHSREKYPGTGIGLAQVKKIVELHSGQIWIDSNEQGGSCFIFTLTDLRDEQQNDFDD